jgi:hypothetical protein
MDNADYEGMAAYQREYERVEKAEADRLKGMARG